MRIYTRLAILGLLLTICIGVSLILIHVQDQRNLTRLAARERANNQRLSENALRFVEKSLGLFGRDYAFWDDMAENTRVENREWIATNLSDSLANYSADAVWIYNQAGALLYSEVAESETTTISQDIGYDHLQRLPLQKEVSSLYREQNGTLIRFVLAPILYHTKSDLNTVASGYLVIAQHFGDQQLFELQSLLSATVTLSSTHPKGGEQIVTELRDEHGKAVGYLVFGFDHSIIDVVGTALRQQVLFLIAAAVICIGVATRYHIIWVLRPVRTIIQKLRDCSDKDLCIIVPDGEEFSQLSRMIDAYYDQQTKLVRLKSELLAELSQSTRFLEALRASTEAVVITDKEGTIIYVNPAWEKLNGYSATEAIGKNPRILHSGKTPPHVYESMWKQLLSASSFSTEEVVNKRKDGSEYQAYISVYPIRDQSNTLYYVGIQQDISKRKEVEQMKTDFISLASHQLRTPLSAIRWFSEVLRDEKSGPLTPEQQSIVAQLHDATVGMIGLVGTLLDITRLESGRVIVEPVPTDVKELVRSLLEEVDHRASNKSISLTCSCDGTIPVVPLDPTLVKEVYMNLLTNAIKYTPEKGEVRLHVAIDGDFLHSTIQDNGIGIPESDQSRVFDKFYRASNVRQNDPDGTGLGLYLAQAIVRSSGGKIWFESAVGKGTTFHFTIPLKGMEEKKGTVKLGS